VADLRKNRVVVNRLALVALAALLAVVVAACGGGTTARDASPVATATIVLQNNAFQPPNAEAPTRTTVTWTNADQVPHDIKFADGQRSPVLQFGGTYQRVFDSPGTFDYECTIHLGMVGRVTVIAR
jgi:plastocyanin